ncbi:hypothetical protein HELRODRAFT_166003 [Helobdella robusta]|uniref:Uncharacterized protein n=1 Tax=Helobdella robusta TaxID=6412 RepID=T1EXK5_HELRO|nr:hypothetical protein HELRODRAFT_166003 [Helobdella robusta]ESN90345.1 hypothetical protein HELRODRAFT_166003 [Helobdella robusta]
MGTNVRKHLTGRWSSGDILDDESKLISVASVNCGIDKNQTFIDGLGFAENDKHIFFPMQADHVLPRSTTAATRFKTSFQYRRSVSYCCINCESIDPSIRTHTQQPINYEATPDSNCRAFCNHNINNNINNNIYKNVNNNINKNVNNNNDINNTNMNNNINNNINRSNNKTHNNSSSNKNITSLTIPRSK